MASAEDLGKKLLAEVEEAGLDEIFSLLRSQNGHSEVDYFGFQPFDRLLQNLHEASPNIQKTTSTWPIVELMSLQPSGGGTNLLYHLCARAVLPTENSGRQSCVVVLDTDGTFSVPKLAVHIQNYLRQRSDVVIDAAVVDDIVLTALKHIHTFRPQSLVSTTATIDRLQDYLFDGARHASLDRRLGLVIVDSASAFYWQDRAEAEDAAFHAATVANESKPPTTGYAELANALKAAGRTFNCPIVFTSHYIGSVSGQHQHTSYRSSFPATFAALPTLRLVVQPAPIRKFPARITLDVALREAVDRQKAVNEGKFICFVNAWGLDERIMRKLSAMPGGCGFEFRIVGENILFGET